MTSRAIYGAVGAIAICVLFLAILGQRITLVASEEVNLYDKPTGGQVVKKLKPGEAVSVAACEDLKHYIVPVVSVNGQDSYVVDGKFHLERRRTWEFGAGPLSFSCS